MASQVLLRALEAGATRMFHATLLVIVALHAHEKIASWPQGFTGNFVYILSFFV